MYIDFIAPSSLFLFLISLLLHFYQQLYDQQKIKKSAYKSDFNIIFRVFNKL